MKKRLTALFLAFALIFALLPAAVLTASAETYSGTCGENLTWTLDTETGVLEITGTGDMNDWSYPSAAPWYSYRKSIQSVSIGNSVASIGNYAFYDCTGLTSVTIPDSVTSIDGSAFSGCTGLTSVTIPDSVTTLGSCAFCYCTGLTSVTIPDSVTSIGDSVFCSCTGLTSVTIPDSVTSIDGSAFSGCTGLTSVTIPDSVTSIGRHAFYGCTGLTSVTIPDSVTSIGDEAFRECAGLTSVTIGNGVTSIGESVFFNCTGLSSVTIGNGVTSIGDYAFADCTGLTSVTIPDSVTSIGDWAFAWCKGLTSVTIPDSVTRIGGRVFSNCTGLSSVTIGNGVTSIGDRAFTNCTRLTDIIVDTGNAYFCSMDGVLYNKDKTVLLRYPAGKDEATFVIPDSVTIIGVEAFGECAGLTSVTIPDSVTSIGIGAFYGCTGLTSVTIPDSVTSIGRSAFSYCDSLTSVTIGSGVTSIGEYAFYYCDSLTSVTIPDSVTSIGKRAVGYYWNVEAGTDEKIDGFTICGYDGSAAQTYAEENGFIFILVGDTPACGHEHAHIEHKDATCTEAGYDRTICDDCGEVISEEEIAALGHDIVADEAVPATCTATGLTAGEHCTRCDYKVAQEEIPMTAHDYKDGVCTVCGAKDPDYKPIVPTNFNDVSSSAWYYDAVNYAVENGLMNGVGNGNFAPDDPMTRAMLVTVLWRYEGSPKEGANTFTDVPAGQWYTDAVAWAAANGIVGGVGNGKFDPNGNITREQMAAILYRYANKKGFDTSKRGDLSKFPDAGKVSEWAKDPIAWAVAEGIIGGSDGKLLPQGNATRAQVSTILMRFIENIAKK